tara:strand:- start:162 stop:527 length:366 start_codon:yes stop_codon:yes gene_type:complete
MLIKFKAPWFGPTQVVMKDKIQMISGRHYGKGIHDVDESLKDYLPSTVVFLDEGHDEIEEETPKVVETLRDFDTERAASDAFGKLAEEADKQQDDNLKKKQDRMAHARAAKGAKKGNKTVK